LITPRPIERVFSAAQKHDAAVTDTLKFTGSNYFLSGFDIIHFNREM
jgi:hypothetical protein